MLDNGFQILHACYALEKLLEEFIKREAVFDLVFFDGMS